ncbi:MAG TPA: hypothetical protein VFP65_24880, partial [Anaeromyxobacteraceae bacterium]|nr:hypothetical protein [Anaeromyxobacteraceae bacterium]
GVEVRVEAPRGLGAAARAELPALVHALRARGVGVASASVLEGGASGAPAPGRALTPPRGSATTARGQAPAGTVAKW